MEGGLSGEQKDRIIKQRYEVLYSITNHGEKPASVTQREVIHVPTTMSPASTALEQNDSLPLLNPVMNAKRATPPTDKTLSPHISHVNTSSALQASLKNMFSP